jgi:hypothetical protein
MHLIGINHKSIDEYNNILVRVLLLLVNINDMIEGRDGEL